MAKRPLTNFQWKKMQDRRKRNGLPFKFSAAFLTWLKVSKEARAYDNIIKRVKEMRDAELT